MESGQLEGSWGGGVCDGVGNGGVHGGVGGWRVHEWVSICTHPTQQCWAGWVGGCGHDEWVGVMGRWA